MWNGCSTQARTCEIALSTVSAQSRRSLEILWAGGERQAQRRVRPLAKLGRR
jgi:hypothetical protein